MFRAKNEQSHRRMQKGPGVYMDGKNSVLVIPGKDLKKKGRTEGPNDKNCIREKTTLHPQSLQSSTVWP